jgi:CopG family nickel-responsive transcriptional regulator
MADLARLSFSVERPLADKLESLCRSAGYENRSEFIRDLIRARLVEETWRADQEAVGSITLVFDHHAHGLGERLTDLQHDHHDVILATTHVHLDHDLCAEVVICRGPASRLRSIADGLRQHKGVLHAALSMSSTGKELR